LANVFKKKMGPLLVDFEVGRVPRTHILEACTVLQGRSTV
jgi:hypothetical protein